MEIIRTKKGYPAIWVGGGASRNTFACSFVLKGFKIAPAVFMRQHGSRCNGDQALVILNQDDILVKIHGRLPAHPDNPDIHIWAGKYEDLTEDFTELEVNENLFNLIPDKVWDGANIYHNRDGSYFVA